jgi:uncharacterized protein (TIGR03437 family)
LYVSDSQINAIVPPLDNPSVMKVTNSGITSPDFPVAIVTASPQVFRNADGSVAALNGDGSINSSTNRAKTGTIVSIWLTGFSDLGVPVGERVTTANNLCSECTVNIYGSVVPGPIAKQAFIQYAGAAPQLPSGVMQINFQVPLSNNNIVYFNVSGGGYASDPVLLYTTN